MKKITVKNTNGKDEPAVQISVSELLDLCSKVGADVTTEICKDDKEYAFALSNLVAKYSGKLMAKLFDTKDCIDFMLNRLFNEEDE